MITVRHGVLTQGCITRETIELESVCEHRVGSLISPIAQTDQLPDFAPKRSVMYNGTMVMTDDDTVVSLGFAGKPLVDEVPVKRAVIGFLVLRVRCAESPG